MVQRRLACNTILVSFSAIVAFFDRKPIAVDGQPTGGACPIASVSRCFQMIFTANPRTADLSSCQLYDPFENCFSYSQCSEMDLAQVCAIEYFKVYKLYLPKEAMIAYRNNLSGKCQPHCLRYPDSKCLPEMKVDERDKDNALVLELHAIKLQLALRVTDPKDGCPRLESTLARIYYHRKQFCRPDSMWCLCKHVKNKTHGICAPNCTQFKNVSTRSGGVNDARASKNALCILLVYFSMLIVCVFRSCS